MSTADSNKVLDSLKSKGDFFSQHLVRRSVDGTLERGDIRYREAKNGRRVTFSIIDVTRVTIVPATFGPIAATTQESAYAQVA
jgi:hypothetical protein